MRGRGIRDETRSRSVHTTDSNHRRPVAENLRDRDAVPPGPDVSRSADITHAPTRDVWLYLAAVGDLFSGRIVGWPMAKATAGRPVADAQEMTVAAIGVDREKSNCTRVRHPFRRNAERFRPTLSVDTRPREAAAFR
jgi:transposase InsO family protein